MNVASMASPSATSCVQTFGICQQMTMTMTTHIEDVVSNKCWASDPVCMSDGVMTPQKKKTSNI